MKRNRPGDDLRRLAIKVRLQGSSSREIAQTIGRSHETIVRYLSSCGRMVDGAYHLNAFMAKALFTEQEVGAAGRAQERALLGWACGNEVQRGKPVAADR